jgi:hypothetical protein
MENQKSLKKKTKYYCYDCDYVTCNNSDYNRHIFTRKHKINIGEIFEEVEANLQKKQYVYECICGNTYSSISGRWKHRKKCLLYKDYTILHNKPCSENKDEDCDGDISYDEIDYELCQELSDENIKAVVSKKDNVQELTGLVLTLIQQNKELTNQIIELSKSSKSINNGTINNTNASTNNSHNRFNLNVFLNETCKDALNMSEFIDSLQITVKDLEETGRLGYASGISRIFINGLKNLEENFRPIHCSDLKREVLYIKNNNEWVKDTEDNKYITLAIKEITSKNIKQIFEWQKLHPEYNNPESKQNDKYQHILMNTMSGSSKEEANNNYSKIIKSLAKEVVISKQLK